MLKQRNTLLLLLSDRAPSRSCHSDTTNQESYETWTHLEDGFLLNTNKKDDVIQLVTSKEHIEDILPT